mgnify:CR=1 FL=1|tara:strand:- start:145 stop:294 length:150 start_codon:yes stop_codon:yes gene_type:complete
MQKGFDLVKELEAELKNDAHYQTLLKNKELSYAISYKYGYVTTGLANKI